jgi:hypothetical protein
MTSLCSRISRRSRGTFATAASHLPCVVAAIGPNQFESREAPAYAVEDETSPVAVLYRKDFAQVLSVV